ncbi:MAG TPA: GDP-mannose 4,6-dehydratase, partial [Candidatus Tumulicola sp.]|nr:GDP-mannose 4,6-dehydratase [Candidatus Tumulicola sp.]
DAARDVLDVRDVVEAYLALAREGERGHVYNVCSGSAVKIRDLLRELIAVARVPVEVRDDPQRARPLDVPLFVGSAEKLRARTGWRPEVPLTSSLREIYDAALELAGNPSSAS